MNNTKIWHGFSLDDLFIICRGNAKNINSKKDEGDISLISAKDNNNGFNKNVIPTSKETIYKNVYTINNNGNGVCLSYYHEYPFIASSDVTILKPKYDKFCNINVALFITTLIRQQKSKFNYGYKMSESRVKKQKILLPLKQKFDGTNNAPTIKDIDFEYMINYINNIITNKKANYKEKIQNKYKDIIYDEQLVSLNKKQWKEFNIDELFGEDNIYRGKRLTKAKQIVGDKPYISSSGISNGVNNFISNDINVRKGNNCLTLANSGSVGACFYHSYEFIASDHVTCLKSNKLNEFSYLFVATMLNRLSTKYNFNREINDKRIKREKILLPLNDNGDIDYGYMEQYIKNILIENMSQSEIK